MTKQTKAEYALFATTLIWASTFVAMKIGLRDISPVLMTGIRFTFAALFFLTLFARRILPLSPDALKKGSFLGLILFLGFISQNIGLNYTTASKSAFITSLMVVFVPVLQFVIEKRSPTVGNILGIAIVVGGLWLLSAPAGSEFNFGDMLTLVCAVLFAYYIVYLDVASRAMTALQLTFLQSAACAVLGMASAFLFEEILFNPTTSMLVSVGYLTLFATVLTTLVQTTFQKYTTPTRAAVIFTIEPVWASIYAYFILGEMLGELGMIGGALIVIGVLVSELSDSIPGLNRLVAGTES
ncbi:MAG: DMT family transporter [Bacteroidetes bacterium]|nr:DMT family transporter [Bacteroidota bacterium]MCW5897001.1 DMT family transporter [Bacteroidota bacterium]